MNLAHLSRRSLLSSSSFLLSASARRCPYSTSPPSPSSPDSLASASASPPSSSSASSSSTFSSRPIPETTEFTGKSAPRKVHERPEALRGLPPSSHKAPWQIAAMQNVKNGQSRGVGGGGESVNSQNCSDFAGPSRPRMVYERPRDLPPLKNNMPLYIALATLGVGVWGFFILHATNQERLSSSVLRQIHFQLRNSAEVGSLLGNNIRLEPSWWAFGDPYISGSINLMQGRIDLKFRVQGEKDSGTVFFTSIRPQQAAAWRIVRYKIIADGGNVIRLEDKFSNADVTA